MGPSSQVTARRILHIKQSLPVYAFLLVSGCSFSSVHRLEPRRLMYVYQFGDQHRVTAVGGFGSAMAWHGMADGSWYEIFCPMDI